MAQDLHMEDIRDDQRTTSEEETRRSSRNRTVSSTPSEPTGKNIPQKRAASSPQSTRTLRPQRDDRQNGSGADPVAEAMKPLTDEERRNWKGWVELESDPVGFVCIGPLLSNLTRSLLTTATDSLTRHCSISYYERMGLRMQESTKF